VTKEGELQRQTLNIMEAATVLGLSPRSVRRRIREGRIPHLRMGRRVLVLRSVLDGMLDGSIKITEATG
jgi:excisionase family DNA binding protein